MPNMKVRMSGRNKKVLRENEQLGRKCNCRIPQDCPLSGECLTKNIIYQATVTQTNSDKTEKYVALTSTEFKKRLANHKTSFRLNNHSTATTISGHIWDLKRQGIDFELNWRILAKSQSCSPASQKCWLCLKEKYFIMFKPELATLNKRSELFTACLHKKKIKLSSQKD